MKIEIPEYFQDKFINYSTIVSEEQNFSNEVYFGNEAPLRTILIQMVNELKSLISGNVNFKNKDFVNELKTQVRKYEKKLEMELNAQEVNIVISSDNDVNAFCFPLFYDTNIVKDNNKQYVSTNRMIDLETIVRTPTGYKFKDKKNKLLLIGINKGLIDKLQKTEDCAGVICHEIGHCFELGVFGSLKLMSDQVYFDILDNIVVKQNTIEFIIRKYLGNLQFLTFLFLPMYLSGSIASIIEMNFNKLFKIKNKEYRTEDHIDDKDFDKKYKQNIVGMKIDRKKTINELKKKIENEYKHYKNEKVVKDKSGLRISLLKILNTLRIQVYMFNKNLLGVLSLSSFAVRQNEKIAHLRKYENFADTFAAAYGFGSNITSFVKELDEKHSLEHGEHINNAVYKVPLLNLIHYSNELMYEYNNNYESVYGNTKHRIESIYKSLYFELKNNKDLSVKEKIQIKEEMDIIKSHFDRVSENRRQYGFFINMIDKFVSRKLKNEYRDDDEVLDILIPMESILFVNNKKK